MDILTLILSVCMMQLGTAYNTYNQCDVNLKPVRWFNSERNHVFYLPRLAVLCSDYKCWTIRYESLQSSYGNTFFSTNEYTEMTGLPYACADTSETQCVSQQQQAPSDGSACCPTHRYATYYGDGDNRDNIGGEECSIIHLLGQKQMLSEGVCGLSQTCDYGECRQMYTVQSLVAWNHVTRTLGREYFRIPSYCACMNN